MDSGDGDFSVFDPSAFLGLEAGQLVADWNAAEQIDITLLLNQFAETALGADAAATPILDSAVVGPADAGDVILLDFGVNAGLSALFDSQPAPLPDA
jgi:hypothetical protein